MKNNIKSVVAGILLASNLSNADNSLDNVVISEATIVSGVPGQIPTSASKTIDFDSEAMLYAVVKATQNGDEFYISEANQFILNNTNVQPSEVVSPQEFEGITIRWEKIESDSKGIYFSNTDPEWHWDQLSYKATPFEETAWAVSADVSPTILEPVLLDGQAVGTMRYRVVITTPTQKVASPGQESRHKGSVSEEVHRISRKGNTGNDIVDQGFSLCNNPYIWGSASWTGSNKDNQAERFVGSDCADLCVAAARLAGEEDLHYSGSVDLSQNRSKMLAEIKSVNIRGVYFQEGGPIKFDEDIQPGDFVYWQNHIGILARDNPPIGYLSENDTVLHTLFKEPREEPISTIYPGRTFSIVRPKL
ncbi:MAG: hypothetical protein H6502_02285 [Candidatus Woesearchaeota archaeon]|nr:MAG: hypothetical protein H6502_02285 [Candidatus Woesearchaeota archaeon]